MRRPGLLFLFGLFAGVAAGLAAGAQTVQGRVPPLATFEEQVAELVNQERADCTLAACPLSPLRLVSVLGALADEHSGSMAQQDYFSHCDFSTQLDPFERMIAAGYFYFSAAENIAGAAATPAAVVAQWMGSAAHRANILGNGFREQGVGYFHQAGDLANVDYDGNSDCDCVDAGETCSYPAITHYWTQLFGMRNSVYPLVIDGERQATTAGTVGIYVYGPATAIDMRFSNDGATWSAWRTFAHDAVWPLAAGDGLRTVYSEVRNATTVYRACDRIWRTGAGGPELLVDGFDCDGTGAWSLVAP
ncbi:MAG: CAP domain-containing protein [Thermoanaerobaculia bacterium]